MGRVRREREMATSEDHDALEVEIVNKKGRKQTNGKELRLAENVR